MTYETEKPFVSVVLPTYNRAYILGDAIKSVLGQTYANLELIVVDDGSTDNTKEFVQTYTDPRIRYVRHEHNKGLAASRNTGIREARGAFVANLDSDDVWMLQKLERELAVFSTTAPETGVVYSQYERTYSNGRITVFPDVPVPAHNFQKMLLEVNLISMQMALVKKDVFENAGYFDESIPALQDWEFWIRASAKTQFVFLPEVLTKGVVLSDSIANNPEKRLRGREKIFIKHEELFKTMPAIYARHAFTIGHTNALRGNLHNALPFLWKAITAQPFHMKYLISFILAKASSVLGMPALYKKTLRLQANLKLDM